MYRTSYHNPLESHKLIQWGGSAGLTEHDHAQLEKEHLTHKAELPYDQDRDGVPDPVPNDPARVGTADEFHLDFGDGYDAGEWKTYWNE